MRVFLAMAWLAAALLAALPARAGHAEPAGPDYAPYAALLRDHVSHGLVDYPGLQADLPRLESFLDALAAVDPSSLDRSGQMAYYINAYNAWTLELVASHYPVASIKKIGGLFASPWKLPLVRLAGKTVSLDHIEHDILRVRFNDPRIHMAINCASKSCPALNQEPYEPARLDEQLDKAAAAFVNDPGKNYFTDGTLYLSRIFSWFESDFGGREGVMAFLRRHGAPVLAKALEENPKPGIVYLDYDWSLNERPPGTK